jgi:hypothetical protein
MAKPKLSRPSEIPSSVSTLDLEPPEENNEAYAKSNKNTAGQIHAADDSYGNIPLEDRSGQDLWVRTRMCFCRSNDFTDCRFHGVDEPGWATCPATHAAKKDKHMLGRWLWARNPNYGKNKRPVFNEEIIEG